MSNQKNQQDDNDDSDLGHRLTLRNLRLEDYSDVKEIMDLVYPTMEGAWSVSVYKQQIKTFSQGQICIEDNGKVVAAAQSIIVDYSKFGDKHNYDEITGQGRFTTHNLKGGTLYGVDIFVHPDYRGLRLGRRLYDARKKLCEELNLERMIAGGRIPGYQAYAKQMTVKEYVNQVVKAEIYDPVLTFQLKNDFHVRKFISNYIPADRESRSYATLLEWINIYYEEPREGEEILPNKPIVRAGVVQWQMRQFNSVAELMKQIEYFVDAVAGYNADFCMFPEFFNGPLMAESNDRSPAAAIRHLAQYSEEIRKELISLAVVYNINIIAGSMPELIDNNIYNVSLLCRRDGTWDSQRKLHITPDEKVHWGLQGGSELKVLETDVCKIGVLVCYDVEFPELARLLADGGMQILFVPYWTDIKNGYLRVRRCAQARAIENECYVVMTGSVGNLPMVENMDIQYSQAAMFSPADFAFPHDAVIAEATPNTEMTLISDLDLDLLKNLHYQGSVRNLHDRRLDLYQVSWLEGDKE